MLDGHYALDAVAVVSSAPEMIDPVAVVLMELLESWNTQLMHEKIESVRMFAFVNLDASCFDFWIKFRCGILWWNMNHIEN